MFAMYSQWVMSLRGGGGGGGGFIRGDSWDAGRAHQPSRAPQDGAGGGGGDARAGGVDDVVALAGWK
jgi:hypothetical protein